MKSNCRESCRQLHSASRSPLSKSARPGGSSDSITLVVQGLKTVLRRKRTPFNISLINDVMRAEDRRWNVRVAFDVSFAVLCQRFELDKDIVLGYSGDSVMIDSAPNYEIDRRSLTPVRRSRVSLSPVRRGNRSLSPPPRRSARSPTPVRKAVRSISPVKRSARSPSPPAKGRRRSPTPPARRRRHSSTPPPRRRGGLHHPQRDAGLLLEGCLKTVRDGRQQMEPLQTAGS